MRHKCTVCEKIFEDGAEEILNGCSCGNKLFYFLSDKRQKTTNNKITDSEYYYENEDEAESINLDLEAVNILEHGKYEIDIDNLMSSKDIVYRYGEGKYSIDIEKEIKKR
jgi:uncharacterized protein